jgi:hypothetical protein
METDTIYKDGSIINFDKPTRLLNAGFSNNSDRERAVTLVAHDEDGQSRIIKSTSIPVGGVDHWVFIRPFKFLAGEMLVVYCEGSTNVDVTLKFEEGSNG